MHFLYNMIIATRFFVIFVCTASIALFLSCKSSTDSKTYNIENSPFVPITIKPSADTANWQTLAAGILTCNIDSFIIANTNSEYGLKNLIETEITGFDVADHILGITITDANSTNNFANFDSCIFCYSTSVYPQNSLLKANNVYGKDNLFYDFIPDVFSTNLEFYHSIVGSPDYTSMYLKKNNDASFTPVTFNYSILGKLRRPITDSMHGLFHFTYKLIVGKKS